MKQFCSVVETASLTKAAELCGITLSGLSKSMTILQAEVGFDLFIPAGRGIAITPIGFETFEKFKKILSILNQVGTKQDSTYEIKLGFLEVFTYNLLSEVLFVDSSTRYKILEQAPGQLEDQIYQGEIDYGYTYLPVGHSHIVHESMSKIQLRAFASKKMNILQKIDEIPFVTPISRLGFHPLSTKERDGWPSELPERKIFSQVNLLSTAIDLVMAGKCAIFMPDFIASKFNRNFQSSASLIEIPLKIASKKLQRDVFFVHREGIVENSVVKKINSRIRIALANS